MITVIPVIQMLIHTVGQNQHEINFIFKIHPIPISSFIECEYHEFQLVRYYYCILCIVSRKQ